ncbi:MAG: helix-turn-helix transcriptional regulator [Chloroflexota bacterium]
MRTDRLKTLREQRGWTQRELAQRAGIGDSQINKYEAGSHDPSATSIKSIAEQLGVSTDYLLGLTDHPRGSYGDALTPEERQWVGAYASGDNTTLLEMIVRRIRQNEK